MTDTVATVLTAEDRRVAVEHLLQVRAARAEALAVLDEQRARQVPVIPKPREGS